MLNTGQQLDNEHHFVRYAQPSRLAKDENGNVIGLLYTAFQLREGEQGLSGSWLEYFDGTQVQQIERCVRAFRDALDVRGGSGFGIAKVGAIKQIATNGAQRSLRVVFTPNEYNPSHADIRQMPKDDVDLSELLAREFEKHLVMNRTIP